MPRWKLFKTTVAAIALLTLLSVQSAWAESFINTNWRGLAVKGYDVVAYFTMNEPVKGTKAYSYKWKDATWRFSSQEHLDLFKAAPEKYAPQYGGY